MIAQPCPRRARLLAERHGNRATLFGARSLLGAVPIEAPANDVEIPQVKWINVANEGEYLGHHQGGFELTREVMAQLISNLRASPKYLVGRVTLPDGSVIDAGSEDVVQYDYEHASEMAPWEGSIPQSGAPAIGWVWDLEIRQDAAGRAQLWALSWLGEQIRGQIQRREYKWVSIAWNPQGVHWQTGEPIGAVLTSIAFTNHPFLQDLADLAARAGLAPAGQRPRSRLPSSEPGVVEAYAATANSNPNPGKSPMGTEAAAAAVNNLRSRLCAVYRLQPQADDDSVIRAAENANTTGGTLAAVLAAFGVANPDALIDASKELPAVREKLASALAELDSLGRADASADEAVAQTDVAAALSARGLVVNGYADANLITALSSQRAATIAAEIAKLPTRTLTIAGKPETLPPSVGDQRLARERGRQAFLASYGVNQNPATQHLSQTFVAGPGGQFAAPMPAPGAPQLVRLGQPGQPSALPQLPATRQPLQLSAPQPLPSQPGQLEPVDLAGYSGRNVTERAIAYLSSRDQGFGKLDHAAKVRRAGEWRRAYEAQFGPLAAA